MPQTGEAVAGARPASGAQFDVPAAYARKPKGGLHADPNSAGVFRDEKGQAYIKSGDQTWPVNFDKDNGTWRVYSPDNPTKYQYPVRADESGNWQVHDEVGLKGGKPPSLPEEIKQRAVQLLQQGMTQGEIGRILGISRSSVAIIARENGIEVKPRILEETKHRAAQLLKLGVSRAEVGSVLGISRDSAAKIARNPDRYLVDTSNPTGRQPANQATDGGNPAQRPWSPQPGTSTGGATYPDPKRQRVDEPQPGPSSQSSAPVPSEGSAQRPDSPPQDSQAIPPSGLSPRPWAPPPLETLSPGGSHGVSSPSSTSSSGTSPLDLSTSHGPQSASPGSGRASPQTLPPAASSSPSGAATPEFQAIPLEPYSPPGSPTDPQPASPSDGRGSLQTPPPPGSPPRPLTPRFQAVPLDSYSLPGSPADPQPASPGSERGFLNTPPPPDSPAGHAPR